MLQDPFFLCGYFSCELDTCGRWLLLLNEEGWISTTLDAQKDPHPAPSPFEKNSQRQQTTRGLDVSSRKRLLSVLKWCNPLKSQLNWTNVNGKDTFRSWTSRCFCLFVCWLVSSFVCWLVCLLVGWLVGWFVCWLVCLLAGWLVAWLAGCWARWLFDWSVGQLVGWLVDWLIALLFFVYCGSGSRLILFVEFSVGEANSVYWVRWERTFPCREWESKVLPVSWSLRDLYKLFQAGCLNTTFFLQDVELFQELYQL